MKYISLVLLLAVSAALHAQAPKMTPEQAKIMVDNYLAILSPAERKSMLELYAAQGQVALPNATPPPIICDALHVDQCWGITTDATMLKEAPPVTFSESVGADGAYRATFEDDGNKWRCYITAFHETDPRNVMYDDTDAATIVCTKPHDVQGEKKAKP